MKSVLTFLLAGGRGERLRPLTKSRAKPLLPFLGSHRLIDFTVFNCIRSWIFRVLALTCNASIELDLSSQSSSKSSQEKLLETMDGEGWVKNLEEPGYAGTADAVRQNLSKITRPIEEVLILAGDHVYDMDYRELLDFHRRKGAMVTVGGSEVDWAEAKRLGILESDSEGRVTAFREKPCDTEEPRRRAPKALASMGIYVFDADFLSKVLRRVPGNDFGHNVLPAVLDCRKVFAFNPAGRGGEPLPWKDVGTIDSYWDTQIEILKTEQKFRVPPGPGEGWLSWRWAERTPRDRQSGSSEIECLPPLVHGQVFHSALSPGVVVTAGADVSDSVLLEGAIVERGARLRRAVVDRGAVVPAFSEIGFDREKDEEEYFVSEGGAVVVTPRGPAVKLGEIPEAYPAPRAGRHVWSEIFLG
ncbi:MAG: glucose-1-phosphate adenylyltransferase family protein [Nitrospinota bacterium]